MRWIGMSLMALLAVLLPLAPLAQAMVPVDCCCLSTQASCHSNPADHPGVCSHGTCPCPAAILSALPPPALPVSTPKAVTVKYQTFRSQLPEAPILSPEPPPPRA